MAQKTEVGVKIVVDTGSANNEVKKFNEEVNQLKDDLKQLTEGTEEYNDKLKELQEAEKKVTKETDKMNDTFEKTTKDTKKSEGGFKTLGTTLKALGVVGAVTAGFDLLKEAFGKNQKVADLLSTVMATITNTLGAFIEVVVNVVTKVSESTNGFDALGKVMKGLITLAMTPLKLIFFEISLAISYAQLAWEKSFFGDDDPETIKKLNARIDETKQKLIETGQDAFKAGKDIVNNIGEAATSVGDVVTGVVEGASKISVKNIYDQAKATTALKNTAKIAEAELRGLVEQYDRQAEQQRQIRDDESRSITERIEANNKLGTILKDQQNAQIALANQSVAAAQAELNANKGNVDLQVALKNAQNERAGILAQITGLESEQKVNAIALNKELLELEKARTESTNTLSFERRKANAELITDELKRLETLKQIASEESAIELQRLQDNINNTKEGTQARVDAEIAYNQKKQEIDIESDKLSQDINKVRKDRRQAEITSEVDNELAQVALRKQLLEQQKIDAIEKANLANQLVREETAVLIEQLQLKRDAEIASAEAQGLSTVEIKNKYAIQEQQINAQLAKSESDLAQAKIDASVNTANVISGNLKALTAIIGAETNAGKAAAVATATIDTYVAAWTAFKQAQKNPIAIIGPAYPYIQAGLAVAGGIANIKKIIAVKTPSGGGGASAQGISAPSVGSITPPPTAPILPTTETALLNQTQVNQIGNAAARAYIVESDVTGGQERIQRLNRAARIA